MTRFVPAAVMALLAVAVATPVNAGYLIVRVILDGGGSGGPTGGGMEVGSGSGGPRPPGIGGTTLPGSGGGRPMVPGMGQPGMGGTAGGGNYNHDPMRSLVVVIPVEEELNTPSAFYPRLATNHYTNPVWKPKLHVNHRGQKFVTNLFTDNASVQVYQELLQTPALRRTRVMDVKDQHARWARTKSDPKALLDLISTALQVGMIDESVGYSDELLAFTTEKPDGIPPQVSAFAKAYKAMQKGIKSPAGKANASAESWRAKLGAQNISTQAHYSLIFWDATSTEVQRRATMLEENFKAFFLWHATRGIELPIPDAPLIAILPKSSVDVLKFSRALDIPPRMPADGFYSDEHDVLVLSPERLDDMGLTFARQSQQIYQGGMGRDRLLTGDGPKLHIEGANGGKRPEEVARMQTLALVDRLIEDQATLCAISREGSRQLFYTSGVLPRYVELPEWMTSGSGSFFCRPKDPAIITNGENKPVMSVAMTTGYGGPNYALHRYFKDFVDKKEFNTDRAALLKNVLTDAYFRGLRDPKDATDPDPYKPDSKGISVAGGTAPSTGTIGGGEGRPPGIGTGTSISRPPGAGGSGMGPPPGFGGIPGLTGGTAVSAEPKEDDPATILRKKRDRLSIKAQATSWALFYYLAKEHPSKLRRFLDELAALPRDLPLDGDTVVAVFCKSFDVDNNKESLTRFAETWLDFIRIVPTISVDVTIVEPKPTGNATTSPLGPGGMPPGGGGNPP